MESIDFEYYIRVLSPAVVVFSLLWISTVIHRNFTRSRSPPSPTGGLSPVSSSPTMPKRHKIRNEFIPRPGAIPVLSQWGASEYGGWYILMSILLLAFLLREFYKNYRTHQSIFSTDGGNFLRRIFISEIYEFAIVILLIYFFSFFAFVAEKFKSRVARNSPLRRGLIHFAAHTAMTGFVGLVTWYLLERRYEVSISFRFAVAAHTFVQYMKMVSYLGTNQYLWTLEREEARRKKTDGSATESDDEGPASNMPKTTSLIRMLLGARWALPAEVITRESVALMDAASVTQTLAHRGIELKQDGSEEKGKRVLLDLVALDEFRRSVYPRNVSLFNFIEFSCMPVLVYEPKYPRAAHIDYHNIVEKLFMITGIIVFNWFLMEHFIIPTVIKSVSGNGIGFIEAMLDMMVPLELFVVFVFYLVFECILGANAELMRLADRETYADWWNSTTFEEFARKWNKPVHEFLLRHVHIEAQVWLGLSRGMATIVTFIYSIVAHEIILLAMFGIFRPYLGFFSLFQIPLWYVMRSPLFQGKVLGNIVFWTCLTIAWPLMTLLYCREYCLQDPRNCKIY